MSWESVFISVTNILKLITMIGPLIEFIEGLFKKIFPGEKQGEAKKALAMNLGRVVVGPNVTDGELSELIDGYVDQKNNSGEFTHRSEKDDLGIGMP